MLPDRLWPSSSAIASSCVRRIFCACSSSRSPCIVSVMPRPVRIMSVCATAISRRFTCWLNAACVRPTRSAARLITPASAMAAKFRSRSMSSWVLMGH